jgi:mRNA-degrading endonuclease RelE of RelBE toxin-antitoxin system
MRYRLLITRQARDELRDLPGHVRQVATRIVSSLAENPFRPDAKELRDLPGRYRIRLQRRRIIYKVDEDEGAVILLRVRRKTGPETYHDLE